MGKHLRNHLVGQQHEDDVVAGRRGKRDELEAVGSRPFGVLVVPVADADLDARVAEVECCAASQVAVPKHGDRFPVQSAGRRVCGAIYPHGSLSWRVMSAGLVIDIEPPGVPETRASVSLTFLSARAVPPLRGSKETPTPYFADFFRFGAPGPHARDAC